MKIIIYVMFLIYLYNTIITFFAWKKKIKPERHFEKNSMTYGILIPCHNEEEVIYDTLQSLYKCKYDKNLYTVYPILDNCTDNTYNNCKKFIEQQNDFKCHLIKVNGGSKPIALNKAVTYLKNNKMWIDDNIIVLDADNKISKSLLNSYSYYHNKGYKILQCKIESLNDESFIAQGFTSSFNNMSEGFQYARNVIGLSASLSGTGFSIDRKVWDEIDFNNCNSLTEDLEFSILSILNGYKIKFIAEDYVLNQNLDEFKPSIIQRIRWARGHMQVSVKLTRRIVVQFLKKPSLQLFDSFLFVNSPSKSLIFFVVNIFLFFNRFKIVPGYVIWGLFIYNIIFILKCNRYKIKYIIPQIFFSFCMNFIVIFGALTWKNTIWKKTEHKRKEH